MVLASSLFGPKHIALYVVILVVIAATTAWYVVSRSRSA